MIEDKGIAVRLFNFVNVTLLILLTLVTLYPFWYVVVASFSHPVQLFAASSGLLLFPVGFSFAPYELVFGFPRLWRSYQMTLFYVVTGGSLSVFLTLLGGYVLSRRYLPGRVFFLMMIMFTMFFGGGLIPTFIVVNALGITDTIFAMILPGAISTYNLIVMKTFLQGIPDEMEESARMDGANDWTILWRVIAPLATPVIAVITLFVSVGIWNSYIAPTIYLRNRALFPLQVILREILLQNSALEMVDSADQEAISETIKYATIIVATIPVLCIYPFLQKYFAKGVMLGSIKE